MAAETDEFTIDGPGDTSETVEIPAGLADVFTEQGEDATAVVADFVVQAFAQQTHAVVHHSQDDVPADLETLNDQMEEIFEERFGVSLADAMGHDH